MIYRILFLLVIIISVSCAARKSSETEVKAQDTDCYYPRKTIMTLTDELGMIGMVGDRYILRDASGKRRLQPCELESRWQVDSMPIIFSGDILEINPGERRYASPFRLREIRERKQ